MKARYITIEREYGSGGTAIARQLAEETGVPCYGHEILEAVSEEQKISVNEIEKYEETVKNRFLYGMYVLGQASSGSLDMLSKEDHVFIAEQAEIRRLAAVGRAIFLGHCASEALKDQKDVVRVFVRCSDDYQKRKRIVNEYDVLQSEADSKRKRFDKKRANYYYVNTGRKWDDYNNYDIVIDSAVLGIDGCTAVLKGLLEEN